MTTLRVSEIPLTTDSPAQRLRRVAAAVRVHFTWWGVHKTLTARQKEEVGVAYAADARFLTAGKKLVDTRHEAFRKLTSLRTRIVQYWKGLTLPYTEAGVRLIRQSDIEGFVHVMEQFREELTEAEAGLNTEYAQLKDDARQRLGRLFNEADYPEEIYRLFLVDWDFPSVEPPSYLQRLNPELYRQEQERVSRRFEEAVQLAEQVFVSEFTQLLSHLTDRLGIEENGQRRVFRNSAVTNLTEFFERFKQLNIRSNAELDQLVEQAQGLVSGISPNQLRDNHALRDELATQMSQVKTQLEGLLVEQPRRRIVRPTSITKGETHATGD